MIKSITKDDIARAVSSKCNVSMVCARQVIDAAFEEISKSLCSGDRVFVSMFGTFYTKERAARVGRNPRNPEKQVAIPERMFPVFDPSKALEEGVRKERWA